jgi:hypothetical protein
MSVNKKNYLEHEEEEEKQETFIIASDQIKAHFPRIIVKNTDFH